MKLGDRRIRYPPSSIRVGLRGEMSNTRLYWAVRLAGLRRLDAVNAHLLKRTGIWAVARIVTTLPPNPAEKTLLVLDRRAELTSRVNAGNTKAASTILHGDLPASTKSPRVHLWVKADRYSINNCIP